MANHKNDKSSLYTVPFDRCGLEDIALVGGKNASLGEMISQLGTKGINVPRGFAITVNVYWEFMYDNELIAPLTEALRGPDRNNYTNLSDPGQRIRQLMERSWINYGAV